MAEIMGRRCKVSKPKQSLASERKHRIVFEKLNQSKVRGGMVDAWSVDFAMMAAIKNWPPRVSQDENALTSVGGVVAAARTEFTTSYAARVNHTHRILFKGKIYNITHLNNFNQQNIDLVITCDTGHNDGR